MDKENSKNRALDTSGWRMLLTGNDKAGVMNVAKDTKEDIGFCRESPIALPTYLEILQSCPLQDDLRFFDFGDLGP